MLTRVAARLPAAARRAAAATSRRAISSRIQGEGSSNSNTNTNVQDILSGAPRWESFDDDRRNSKTEKGMQRPILIDSFDSPDTVHMKRDNVITRSELVARLICQKKRLGMSFEDIGKRIGSSPAWVVSAIYGQAAMEKKDAEKLVTLLKLDDDQVSKDDLVTVLQEAPLRQPFHTWLNNVPTDPLLYRLHEVNKMYGLVIKALVHEKFGDGIMSAVDFGIDVTRESQGPQMRNNNNGMERGEGDYVKITLCGKFLPFKKF